MKHEDFSYGLLMFLLAGTYLAICFIYDFFNKNKPALGEDYERN